MPSGKASSRKKRSVEKDSLSTQSSRGGQVLTKLFPKSFKENIFRKNKNHQNIINFEDSISQPKLPPLIHGRQGKDNHINGSDTSLNQLKSPSQSSGVSSGYGSQPESGRPSLQEQYHLAIDSSVSELGSEARKVSLESGTEVSPISVRKKSNGIYHFKEEASNKVWSSPPTKNKGTLFSRSPKTSDSSPLVIKSFGKRNSQSKEPPSLLTQACNTVKIQGHCYKISSTGDVKESPVSTHRKKSVMDRHHKMSLPPRKPSFTVQLPPINSSSSRYSVPNRHTSRPWHPAPELKEELAMTPGTSSGTFPGVIKVKKTSSGENPVATVSHRVPPPTPMIVSHSVDDKADNGKDYPDPDRPRSRRKNAVVSAEDKPDVSALLAAIPQIKLISPTPIPTTSHPPSLSESTCTSPSSDS